MIFLWNTDESCDVETIHLDNHFLTYTCIKLVDIETKETIENPYESGEVWARGPQVTKGYINNDEATKNSITEDGWIKTGNNALIVLFYHALFSILIFLSWF